MRIVKCLAVAAFAAAAAGIGIAQDQPQNRQRPGGFGGGGFGGPTTLVTNKAVQEDIKVTDEQKTKIEEWAKESGPKIREKMMEKMKDIGQDTPREERTAKMAAISAEINKEVYEQLGTVLKPDQVKRVQQIAVQQSGIRAFSQADVQTALKLTDEQKGKIKDVADEYRKDMQDLQQGNSRPDASKMAALRKEALEKAAKVLTDDQQKAWSGLVGEPFDTSKLNTFGGPGGGRRPQPQNNN